MIDREITAEILENLADEFESGQMAWCQGHYSKPDPGPTGYSYCTAGAIDHKLSPMLLAGVPLRVVQARHAELLKAIARVVDPTNSVMAPHTAVTGWNDRPERTLPEVIDALKHAAKDLRNAA
jgi:hypothetical protein